MKSAMVDGAAPALSPSASKEAGGCWNQEQAITEMPEDSWVTCQGCGDKIDDRFYLCALNRRWHNSCLKCCECRRQLAAERSCYVREGFIYCKDDYSRRYGVHSCSKCGDTIYSGDMVMRAKGFLFHVQCFCCTVCDQRLMTGDQFAMCEDGLVYCRSHYQLYSGTATTPPPSLPPQQAVVGMPVDSDDCIERSALAAMETPLTSPLSRGRMGRGILDLDDSHTSMQGLQEGRSGTDSDSGCYGSSGGGCGGGGGTGLTADGKKKRMRTSFKHCQLRVMRQYFAVSHNPDAKDLKQLVQKTGLSKRVLQVWFQNARAKYRRCLGKGRAEDAMYEVVKDSAENLSADAASNHSSMSSSRDDTSPAPMPSLATRGSLHLDDL